MYLDKVPITAITKLWLIEFFCNFHVTNTALHRSLYTYQYFIYLRNFLTRTNDITSSDNCLEVPHL